MNVKNCKKCGKLFNYVLGEVICPSCREKAEEKFQTVKKYVQDNRRATVNEICEECDVDQKQVRQWVREERLVFSDDSPVKINCEICGAQINTGRYCKSCKKETAHSFSGVAQRPGAAAPATPASSTGAKMHTRF